MSGLAVKNHREAVNAGPPARLHILEKMLEAIEKPP